MSEKKYIKATTKNGFIWEMDSNIDEANELAAFAILLIMDIAKRTDEKSRKKLKSSVQELVIDKL